MYVVIKAVVYIYPPLGKVHGKVMFRHTYATMLYISGTELLDMKYLLGHSDIKTTLQIYAHIQNSLREVDISKYKKYI